MESKLKLFLHIEGCGIGNWYCYETFDEFYEEILNEYYDFFSKESPSKEETEKRFKECDFIDLLEISPDTVLRFTLNDGECSSFPDELLNMPEDTQITVKEFLKYCEKGYLGFELFEIV